MDCEEGVRSQEYSHLDALLDDVIQLRHTLDTLGMHTFEKPDDIPKNIALSQRPPKQEVIDAHVTRFSKHSENN